MTRLAKVLLIAAPVILGLATLAVLARRNEDDRFRFLTNLHPVRLRYEGYVGAGSILLGSRLPLAKSDHLNILALPEKRRDELDKLIDLNLPTAKALSLSIIDETFTSTGPGASQERVRADSWDDPSGDSVYLISGPSVAEEARLLTKDPIPPGCCLVLTSRPQTWAERQLSAFRRFLHFD